MEVKKIGKWGRRWLKFKAWLKHPRRRGDYLIMRHYNPHTKETGHHVLFISMPRKKDE